MSRFIVFDVETPNCQNNRMSAIGITIIENGEIVDDYYSLVNPETHFDYFNIQLTGISEDTVNNAPAFPQVWQEIEPYMSSGMIVAHNAVFDLSVPKKCLRDYDIQWKPYISRWIKPSSTQKLRTKSVLSSIALIDAMLIVS